MTTKQTYRIYMILRYFCVSCVIMFGIISIIGSGGGGGDGGSAQPQITYTGLTTQAEITDTNGDLVYDYDSGVLNWTDL